MGGEVSLLASTICCSAVEHNLHLHQLNPSRTRRPGPTKGPEVNATKVAIEIPSDFCWSQLSPSRPKRRDLRSGGFLGGKKERWRDEFHDFIICTRKLHSFAPGSKLLILGMVITGNYDRIEKQVNKINIFIQIHTYNVTMFVFMYKCSYACMHVCLSVHVSKYE